MTDRNAVKQYIIALVALLLLTGLTVGVSFISLGAWGLPTALVIACAKAAVVVFVFMRIRWTDCAALAGMAICMVLLLTLIGLTALDGQLNVGI